MMQSFWWLRFLIALIPHVIIQESAKYLIRKNITTTNSSRKFLHIAHGIVWLLTWPLFDHSLFSSQLLLAFIPFSMTIKILLVVYGLMKDDDLMESLKRANGELEIFGVAMYGILHFVEAITLHTKFIGIYALICLCAGDGFASLIGSIYGKNYPLPSTNIIPFNPKKTSIGFISFIISSILFGILFQSYFQITNIIIDRKDTINPIKLIVITLITAVIESCCRKYDNLIVFVIPIILNYLL